MHEQQQVLGEQRFDLELGIVDREVDDRRVELAGQHARHDRGGAAFADDRVHARVAGGHGAEQLRHQPAGGGADHADAGVAGDLVVERGDVGGDVVDLVQDPAGAFDDPLALVGQPAVGAVDQRDAELALELGDVAGHVGLDGEQGPGRRRERPVIGDGDDGGELTNVHVAETNWCNRKNRCKVSFSSTCQMHSFTCILSQTRTKREDPPSSARRDSHHRSPTDGIPRLRRPDPPSGRFPFSPLSADLDDLGCRPWPPPSNAGGGNWQPDGRASGAAFFDLDRTLLRGASGEVFSDAMRSAGLVSRTIPGERYIYGLFNTVGETLPSMALARQAVNFAKGRSRASVQAAADGVADRLVGMVQPFARSVFDEHRAAGAAAGAGHHDPVRPRQAARRPARPRRRDRHAVRASRTTATPTTARSPVPSSGRPASSRPSARGPRTTVSTCAESWFYSDSVYDTPLLSAVGTPRGGQPRPAHGVDGGRAALADAQPRRLAGVGQGAARRARAAAPGDGRSAAPRCCPTPTFGSRAPTGSRPTVRRSSSATTARTSTPTVMAMVVAKTGRTVRFLGKKEVFDVPVVGSIAKAMGGIRVDRGTGSDEPLAGCRRSARRRRVGGDHAAGHDPARAGVLRPGAEGPMGRGPPGPAHRCPGDPDRSVGHREGLAAQRPAAQHAQRARPARGHVRRSASRCELGYKSLDADTKRIMRAIVELLPPEAQRAARAHTARSSPPPTRPATRATRTTETGAAPGQTDR